MKVSTALRVPAANPDREHEQLMIHKLQADLRKRRKLIEMQEHALELRLEQIEDEIEAEWATTKWESA